MNGSNEFTGLVDDLAAHWAEPTLEVLKNAGALDLSVDTEVQTWRTLKKVLHRELGWQWSFRVSAVNSLSALMERVIRKSARRIARSRHPEMDSYDFESRVQRLTAGRRSNELERRVYAQLVRHPMLRSAFKPPSRTDFTPHLRVSALAS
jgi:hypothetical protein